MQKAVGAVLYHFSDAHNPDACQQFCLPGESSWCKLQVDILVQMNIHRV